MLSRAFWIDELIFCLLDSFCICGTIAEDKGLGDVGDEEIRERSDGDEGVRDEGVGDEACRIHTRKLCSWQLGRRMREIHSPFSHKKNPLNSRYM